jgi:hypothetical protein
LKPYKVKLNWQRNFDSASVKETRLKEVPLAIEKTLRLTSGLAQAGVEVFWLKGSTVVPLRLRQAAGR